MTLESFVNPIVFPVLASAVPAYSIPTRYEENKYVATDACTASFTLDSTFLYTKPIEYSNIFRLEGKIISFIELKENWDGYKAFKPSIFSIANAINFLRSLPRYLISDIEVEDITPTPHGTIEIDFKHNGNLLSVEIGVDKIGFFTDYQQTENLTSDGEQYSSLALPEKLAKAIKLLYQKEILPRYS